MRFASSALLIGLSVLVVAQPARADWMYNESVDGDLSNDGFSPTSLDPFVNDNMLGGHVGGSEAKRSDFFMITVPPEWTLSAITVVNYPSTVNTTFFGIEDAPVFDTAPGNPNYFGFTAIGPRRRWHRHSAGDGRLERQLHAAASRWRLFVLARRCQRRKRRTCSCSR